MPLLTYLLVVATFRYIASLESLFSYFGVFGTNKYIISISGAPISLNTTRSRHIAIYDRA